MEALSTHPFDPWISDVSEVLILGTFPSLKSFEYNYYYAHPRNQFWPIMEILFETQLPDLESKQKLIEQKHLALWDVVAACSRENSLDSNLKKIQPNDIEALLQNHLSIHTILFTGKTAQKLYQKHFRHLEFPTALLPSPSPAYCSITKEEKVREYRRIFSEVKIAL